MNVWEIGFLAFLAEAFGLSIGAILLYVFKLKSKRLVGMFFGATSGLMIALMCFDVLPEALAGGPMSKVFVGVVIGICIGLLLDDVASLVTRFMPTTTASGSSMATTGIVLFIGIAIHNIPEGFALGTLAITSSDTILKLIFIIALHSIPEGIAVAIPLKAGGMKLSTLLILDISLGGIMGVSAGLGYTLSTISPTLITLMLGLAAGVILYIVCEELLPESRKIWNGRMTTVATIVGILLGILLVG